MMRLVFNFVMSCAKLFSKKKKMPMDFGPSLNLFISKICNWYSLGGAIGSCGDLSYLGVPQ